MEEKKLDIRKFIYKSPYIEVFYIDEQGREISIKFNITQEHPTQDFKNALSRLRPHILLMIEQNPACERTIILESISYTENEAHGKMLNLAFYKKHLQTGVHMDCKLKKILSHKIKDEFSADLKMFFYELELYVKGKWMSQAEFEEFSKSRNQKNNTSGSEVIAIESKEIALLDDDSVTEIKEIE